MRNLVLVSQFERFLYFLSLICPTISTWPSVVIRSLLAVFNENQNTLHVWSANKENKY